MLFCYHAAKLLQSKLLLLLAILTGLALCWTGEALVKPCSLKGSCLRLLIVHRYPPAPASADAPSSTTISTQAICPAAQHVAPQASYQSPGALSHSARNFNMFQGRNDSSSSSSTLDQSTLPPGWALS